MRRNKRPPDRQISAKIRKRHEMKLFEALKQATVITIAFAILALNKRLDHLAGAIRTKVEKNYSVFVGNVLNSGISGVCAGAVLRGNDGWQNKLISYAPAIRFTNCLIRGKGLGATPHNHGFINEAGALPVSSPIHPIVPPADCRDPADP